MDNKDFVPFETARKLKAAGFDEPCSVRWVCEPDDVPSLYSSVFSFKNKELEGLDFTAPTLWQAAKWLREEKKIDIDITSDFVIDDNEIINRQYFFTVWDNYKGKQLAESFLKAGDTYEAALSVGIDAALDLIIKKTLGSL